MVNTFRSIRCTLEDFEIYEALLKQIGSIKLRQVLTCKHDDIIGLQAFCGDAYLGKTLLLTPVAVYYDKWGFPIYRFSRYTGKVTNASAYRKFKTVHLMGADDV